ncbi:MAG: gluconate 2-dehydrogenase subunit 3 family protein [Nannocystaceae bacterium]
MSLGRRTIARYGLGGLFFLACGGLGLGLRVTKLRQSRVPLAALSPRRYSVLAALADRITPAAPPFPSPSELQVAETIDTFLARSPAGLRDEIGMLLDLLENALAGLLLDGRPRTFSACSPDEQDRVIRAWQTSRIGVRRKGIRALQTLCGGIYYDHPLVYPAIGYAGPPPYAAGPRRDTPNANEASPGRTRRRPK